jgi:hypothetical protein
MAWDGLRRAKSARRFMNGKRAILGEVKSKFAGGQKPEFS